MTQLHDDVEAFQKMIGFEAPPFPQVTTAEVMRQKLRVFMEEAFEAIEASVYPYAIIHDGTGHTWGDRVREFKNHCLSRIVDKMPVSVDLDGLIDACADIDYTCEGLRQAIGVHDAEPYADEVQRANMDKRGGHLDANGKWRKPEGWRPPDIRGIRERQVREYWEGVQRETENAATLARLDATLNSDENVATRARLREAMAEDAMVYASMDRMSDRQRRRERGLQPLLEAGKRGLDAWLEREYTGVMVEDVVKPLDTGTGDRLQEISAAMALDHAKRIEAVLQQELAATGVCHGFEFNPENAIIEAVIRCVCGEYQRVVSKLDDTSMSFMAPCKCGAELSVEYDGATQRFKRVFANDVLPPAVGVVEP